MSQTADTSPISDKTNHAWLWLVLLLYLVVTFGYSFINPLFEAPDEQLHFFTVEYVATNGRLPFVAQPDYDVWMGQEAAQPPLYYVLGALLIAPIDTGGAREQVWLNPFANIGYAAATTNLNRAIQTPASTWPLHGFALAAHMLRGFSTLLGVGTLLFVYGSGRFLWPHRPQLALLATALAAFLPQFNFLHSAVTNDALVIFFCAAGLWQMLRVWFSGISRRRLLLLGITVGLAALSKNAGVLLGLYSVGFLFVLALRDVFTGEPAAAPTQERWRYLLTMMGKMAVFVILPFLLLAGWLWWRNAMLYGDWTATEPFIRIAGGDKNYSLWQVLRQSQGIRTSLFAVFGWFNVLPPPWVFWIWNALALAALAGVGKTVIGKTVIGNRKNHTTNRSPLTAHRSPITAHRLPITVHHLPPLLLLSWLLAVYAGLVMFMMRTEAAQGRLLFPAITPLALGTAFGLSRWGRAAIAAPVPALITTVFCLLFVIRPAYNPPPHVDSLPETAVSLNADMGAGLTLVGAAVETEQAVPGDTVWFTLYWQANQPPVDAPEFKLELIGQEPEAPLGSLHSYHGRGLYPANLWSPGELIADRFAVRLHEIIDTPVLAQVHVRLIEPENSATAYEITTIGTVKITPQSWPAPTEAVLARLGDGIQLTAVSLSTTSAQPGDTITIDATWQTTAPVGVHYTTLIHLAEAGQPPLATGDSPPRHGSYPTQVWAANEVIPDQYTLTIPKALANGRYPLWIGMYDTNTVHPLPLWVDGEMQGDGRFLIGRIKVRE